MQAELRTHLAFHYTGKRLDGSLQAVDARSLRPALLARFRDLTALRYDFPLILVPDAAQPVRSLSSVVDRVLQHSAPPGGEGERMRQDILRLERAIRTLASHNEQGTLSDLWTSAAATLASMADAQFMKNVAAARRALAVDGEVVDCHETLPLQLLTHVWAVVQEQKAAAFRRLAEPLMLRLSDILLADRERSAAGCSAASLASAFGPAHAELFDYEAMSRVLTPSAPQHPLPEQRRRRIEQALAALRSQRFFSGEDREASARYGFCFESCAAAARAWSERLPDMAAVVKALAIAELEIEGRYVDAIHDAYFEQYGPDGLTAEDKARFPDYLVRVRQQSAQCSGYGELLELLACGIPVKVAAQIDDLFDHGRIGNGSLEYGMRSAQLAAAAMALNDVYVLQGASSALLELRDAIVRAMAYPGASLFSIYSGACGRLAGLPPYLMAAAAGDSRAFPAFTYDPSAGPDWASRLALTANSQVERDWPVHPLHFEDPEHQAVSIELPFTYMDFLACDPRHAAHFAAAPRAGWSDTMVPAAECLSGEQPGRAPYVLLVDDGGRLQRAIVDGKLVREAGRCRAHWHSLQELGGVHNSHAERLVARERSAWLEQQARAAPAEAPPPLQAAPIPAPATASPAVAPVAAEPAAAPQPSPDEAYIETPRCTTCDECTQINNRMFAYDANKQAYIADLGAGSYRQLVEAAESCQVSIIHPGKPRDRDEPGLEELMRRAEPFL